MMKESQASSSWLFKSATNSILEAANLAAIIFKDQEWKYGDGDDAHIPDVTELEGKILQLIYSMTEDTTNITSGRLSVEVDDLVGYRILLNIGDLSEEEFGSV